MERNRLIEAIRRRAFVRFWRRMLAESIQLHYGLRRTTCQMPRGPLGLPCGRPAREFDHVHPRGRWWVVRWFSYDLRIILYWLEWMAYVDGGDDTKQLRLACRRCNAGYNPHRHFRRR